MNDPATLLSFIVVAKNSEATIERCVDLIIKQGFKSFFELLIIIDLFADTTIPLAQQIAQRDLRVRVLVRGVDSVVCQIGNARNYGIENAFGKWIWFIDADDWMADGVLVKIMLILESQDIDLVVCNFVYAWSDNGKLRTSDPAIIDRRFRDRIVGSQEIHTSSRELFDYIILGQSFLPCWRAIVLRDFIVANNICFHEDVVHEDNIFAMAVWLLARQVYIYSGVCYYHYRGQDSSSSKRHASPNQLIDVGKTLYRFLSSSAVNDRLEVAKNKNVRDMLNKEKLRALLQRYHYAKNLRIQQRIEFFELLDREIDKDVIDLLNRYGDNRDIAFFDFVRRRDPERYHMLLGLDDALMDIRNTALEIRDMAHFIDDNVNRVAKTLNFVDNNLQRTTKTVNFIDDHLNKTTGEISQLGDRLLATKPYNYRRDSRIAITLASSAKILERYIRRSVKKITLRHRHRSEPG